MDAIWTTLRSLLVIGGFLLKRRNSRCEFYANAVDLALLGHETEPEPHAEFRSLEVFVGKVLCEVADKVR